MILKTLFVALAGATVWKIAARQRARTQGRALDHKPQAENLWEAEGGALRESGPQIGPQPNVVQPS